MGARMRHRTLTVPLSTTGRSSCESRHEKVQFRSLSVDSVVTVATLELAFDLVSLQDIFAFQECSVAGVSWDRSLHYSYDVLCDLRPHQQHNRRATVHV